MQPVLLSPRTCLANSAATKGLRSRLCWHQGVAQPTLPTPSVVTTTSASSKGLPSQFCWHQSPAKAILPARGACQANSAATERLSTSAAATDGLPAQRIPFCRHGSCSPNSLVSSQTGRKEHQLKGRCLGSAASSTRLTDRSKKQQPESPVQTDTQPGKPDKQLNTHSKPAASHKQTQAPNQQPDH